MRIKILIGSEHPEIRVLLPVATEIGDFPEEIKAAISTLGELKEISHDDLNPEKPSHKKMMDAISGDGVCFWMISAEYNGLVELG